MSNKLSQKNRIYKKENGEYVIKDIELTYFELIKRRYKIGALFGFIYICIYVFIFYMVVKSSSKQSRIEYIFLISAFIFSFLMLFLNVFFLEKILEQLSSRFKNGIDESKNKDE